MFFPVCTSAAAEARAKLTIVQELQAKGKTVAFIGQSMTDTAALAQADLSLVANVGNETLMSLSNVANVSGDHWRFKHLFTLGQELLMRRTDLNAVAIAGATAIWVALFPMFGALIDGYRDPRFLWLTNPLQLGSPRSAIFAASLVVFLNLAALGTGIVGLHRRQGAPYRWARTLFSGAFRTIQVFVISTVMIKAFDLIMTTLQSR